ncbi:hypothetical protein QX776_17030 [Alteromonadaceae bacterium BrNp21-10]|nr:hypothetical protein [Alteromonadaceae bacterium BrNp21-10]
MKKLICAFCMVIGLQVQAGEISVAVSQTSVDIGDVISLTLSGTALDSFDTFGLDILFDTSLFAVSSGVFDYPATGVATDLWLDSLFFSSLSNGVAASFADFATYSGDLLLARFELTAIAAGYSSFSVANVEFYDSLVSVTDTLNVTTASDVSATVAAVSEPSMLVLFLLAGVALLGRNTKISG